MLDSIIEDIKDDEKREFKLIDNGYEFNCKVNYPNNKKLVSQKVEIDKKLNIKTVSVLDKDGNVQIKMTFNNIDLTPKFESDYFKLSSLIKNNKKEENNNQTEDKEDNQQETETTEETLGETTETTTIEDIIYPMYLPKNTYLTGQEKLETETGERLILTFEGDNPFVLVEETIAPSESNIIVSTNGEIEFLTDVIGIVNENSVNWVSNNIEYYVLSDVLETSELIEIARSISVLPVSK